MRPFCFAVPLLLAGLTGCGMTTRDVVVHDAAVLAGASTLTIESAQSTAEFLYKAEQEASLRASEAGHLSRGDAEARVASIRSVWGPVWSTFSKARGAQLALLDVIKIYDQTQKGLSQVLALSRTLAGLESQLADALVAGRVRLAGPGGVVPGAGGS